MLELPEPDPVQGQSHRIGSPGGLENDIGPFAVVQRLEALQGIFPANVDSVSGPHPLGEFVAFVSRANHDNLRAAKGLIEINRQKPERSRPNHCDNLSRHGRRQFNTCPNARPRLRQRPKFQGDAIRYREDMGFRRNNVL